LHCIVLNGFCWR